MALLQGHTRLGLNNFPKKTWGLLSGGVKKNMNCHNVPEGMEVGSVIAGIPTSSPAKLPFFTGHLQEYNIQPDGLLICVSTAISNLC